MLGPPGAGKGTLAVKLSERLEVPHVSTGQVFRTAIREGTALGHEVEAVLDSGSLVSDALTIGMVRERLAEADAAPGALLDGYPRTLPQATALADFAPVMGALAMVVDHEQIIQRLSGRRTCGNCGAVYHIQHRPTKVAGTCDVCGRTVTRRPDDEPAAIRHRLAVYQREIVELEGYFRDRGLLRPIDAAAGPAAVLEAAVAVLLAPASSTDRS